MSLILEALRKSEAERRRGQAPDLLADAVPVAPAAGRAPANWSVLLPVLGAALITLLLVGWWLRPSAEPVANDATRKAPADDTAARAPTTETAAVPAPASVRPQPSLSPPLRRPASPPVAAAASAASPASAPTSAPMKATAPATAPTLAPAHAPPPATVEPEPSLPTAAQVASLEPPAPTFASPGTPLRLSDLSTGERAQLPTLKVSMHMWAPDAGSRFAIIDGTRVNEGDRVGDATIEAIQQDGVMLSWHGRQIRLPIR